jgi:hypothetical protein
MTKRKELEENREALDAYLVEHRKSNIDNKVLSNNKLKSQDSFLSVDNKQKQDYFNVIP